MLREYEITIIAKADLPDNARGDVFSKYENIIKGEDGTILAKDDWGVRKLAHPISKQHKGHYQNYDLVASPDNLKEAERLMRIDENVLRYMAVNIGENVDIEARKVEIEKNKQRELEAAREKSANG